MAEPRRATRRTLSANTATLRRRTAPVVLLMPAICGMSDAMGQPANDRCRDGLVVSEGSFGGTTLSAADDGDDSCNGSASADVYYLYSPSQSGSVVFSTCDAASYDSVISIHAGCPATVANQLGCNDDACPAVRSRVALSVIAGTTYIVRVAGFALATDVPETTVSGATTDAVDDADVNCVGNTSPDVYYRFVPAASGSFAVHTCAGASYDTVLTVHTACPASAANQIACNDDDCALSSRVYFTGQAGIPIIIRVAGFGTAFGSFSLTISRGTPSPPVDGPDVILRDMTDTRNFGQIGDIRAYAFGSTFCNLGNSPAVWIRETSQHPVMAMNMYRLHAGVLEQIGMGWCKHGTFVVAQPGCGLFCSGPNGALLYPGCQDTYSTNSNGNQSVLGPRSDVNAFSGVFSFPFTFGQPSGDAIYKRIQVRQSDLVPDAIYFVEGVVVSPDDAPAGNALNNATYRPVAVDPTTFDLSWSGSAHPGQAAVEAWRDHGLGLNVPDAAVRLVTIDVPAEGRFILAARVTQVAPDRWRYRYALQNLNSDRAAVSFLLPLAPAVALSDITFRDADYHSGEPYDAADWEVERHGSGLVWRCLQTYDENPSANALRWATMYSFAFEARTPPIEGEASIGLFKPGTPTLVGARVDVPSAPRCAADWNFDGIVSSQDFYDFLGAFLANNADFNRDGQTNSQDFFDFLASFFEPC